MTLLGVALGGVFVSDAAAQQTVPSTLQDAGDRAREERASRSEPTRDETRFRLFLDGTVLSPSLPARVAFAAALDQRGREPIEWGRSTEGFGKRFAARAGLTMTQAGVQHATAALLKVDPRGEQQRCGCSHPLRRTAHALTKTFVTRDGRGRLVPNVPLFAGAYGGAMIATAWYPPSYNARQDAMRVASLTVVAQAGANVFREFSPELKRLVPKKKKPEREK